MSKHKGTFAGGTTSRPQKPMASPENCSCRFRQIAALNDGYCNPLCQGGPDEDIGTYCNVCQQGGFWSSIWCKRVINWDDHVRRGASYKHICARLLEYKNSDWLMHQRAKWVPVDGSASRNSITAGRTGTRCNIRRPQVRWEDGIKLSN